MLRRVCSKVFAVDQTLLPTPSLLRCLRANYSTDDANYLSDETEQTTKQSGEAGFCQVSMLGRVANSPNQILTNDGSSFTIFSLAVRSGTKTKFHDVVVNMEATQRWLMNSIDAGDRLIVNGHLSYTTPEDDPRIKRYKVKADRVHLISRSAKNMEAYKNRLEAEGRVGLD